MIVPRSERGSGIVSIKDCVNGERQNLTLYALRSNEVVIAATAELKLKKVIRKAKKKKKTSELTERENSSPLVLERNRKH